MESNARIVSRISAGITLSALLGVATPALAWQALSAQNESTLARSFVLPMLGQNRVLAPDEQSLRFALDISNEFVLQNSATEALRLDGETSKLGLMYRRGWSDDVELTAELPVYRIGGGFMDSFIENWHDVFGLPNGGRETVPQDQRRYSYTRNGVTLLNERSETTSIGDLALGLGWQAQPRLAVRAELKLPTGNQDRLTGGNLGGAVWADWTLPFGADSRWDGFVSGGLSAADRAGALSSLQKTFVTFGGIGIGYDLSEHWQLLTQVNAHSALYNDSALDALQQPGVQLTVGGRWRMSHDMDLDFYFQEDPIVSSSPDFSLHVGLSVR